MSEVIQKLTDRSIDENISTTELKELAKPEVGDALLEKAKEISMTTESLRAMKAEIEAEREEIETSEEVEKLKDEEKQALEELVKKIDALIEPNSETPEATEPTEVSDIFVEKPADKMTFKDRIDSFIKSNSFIGTLISSWIGIRRFIGSIVGNGDEQETRNLETLHGRFFGGRETARWYNQYFENNGVKMKVVEGYGDGPAYAALKIKQQTKIREKAKEILPTLDDASTPADQRQAAMDAAAMEITWEAVLAEVADTYVKNHPTDSDNPDEIRVTTLNGIVRNQKPKVQEVTVEEGLVQ